MRTTTGKNHHWDRHAEWAADLPDLPWMTFADDQADVPPEVRAEDLLRLAGAVAEITDPRVPATLQAQDRLLLAMAVPNLPDGDARRRLLDIVDELHQAELADRVDPAERCDPEYRSPEDYRESAATLARELVDADLKAAAVPGLRLVSARNVPMAGAR